MLNSKKIAAAAAAGVLGGFALVGLGAAGAAADGPGKCVDDGNGHVSCVQQSKYKVTTDKAGNVQVVNHSTQTCPTAQSEVSCVSSVAVPGGRH